MRLHSLQEALKTFFGKGDLQKGLDGDEAACLGSALYAASLSTAFRLRKFGVKDIATAAISVLRPARSPRSDPPHGRDPRRPPSGRCEALAAVP